LLIENKNKKRRKAMSTPKLRPLIRAASLALPASVASAPLQAQTPDFAILYHESISSFDFAESRMPPQVLGAAPLPAPTLSFVALGRRFDIDLRPNDRLTRTLDEPTRARLGPLELYEGEVRNAPRSWVRLTRHDGVWSGVISDGVELFAIESYAGAAPYLVLPGDAASDMPIIYRWKDTVGPLVDEIGPVVAGRSATPSALVATTSLALFSPVRQIDVGLVSDSLFARQRVGPSPEAQMLSMANVVDGIFVTQVGVHLNVNRIETHDANSDPFQATDPQTLLDELATYKSNASTLREQGLVHLFMGRDFPGTDVVGMAKLASICDVQRAVGLTKVRDIGSGSLIAAHEIGHNFGAPHDGEAGPCANESSSYIMSPNLNGSREFSACSIQQMLPVIASASCLYEIPPAQVSLSAESLPTQVLFGTEIYATFVVENHGGEAFNVTVTATSDGATISSVTYLNCTWANYPGCVAPKLANDETMQVSVRASAKLAGNISIDVAVQASNDSTPSDYNYRFEVEVLPAVALRIDRFDATPVFPRPYGTVNFVLDASVGDPIPATQAEAQIVLDPRFAVLSLAAPGALAGNRLLPRISGHAR
jgi:hypothetical protein